MDKSVNEMLTAEISKVNHTLVPQGYRGDVRSVRTMQDWLSRVIDALGEQSTNAQGLNRVITTAEKLRNAPNHTLYLMKDPHARDGNGEVVGLVKVGRKHLFLWDEAGRVRELEPLCVLDFYVLGSRQRHGLGTRLFQYMLDDQQVSVEQLAIDGPSAKMEAFLARNYNVRRLLRQTNNFAVAPAFFSNSDLRSVGLEETTSPLVGRFAAHRPASAIATVIHGSESAHYDIANSDSRASSPEHALATATVEPEPLVLVAEEAQARPASLAVLHNNPTPAVPAPDASPAAGTPRRDSQLTDRGYFDVKFYHNKLW